jgi:hypothetical protein
MTAENIEATRQTMDALAAETGLTITVGYIGNCGPNGEADTRTWFAWVNNACHNHNVHRTVSLGDPTTGQLIDQGAAWCALVAALAAPTVTPKRVTDVWGEVITTREQSARLIEGTVLP